MRGELIVPMPLYGVDDPRLLSNYLGGYLHSDRFVEALNKERHTISRVIDLNFVVNILIGAVSQYRRLLNRAGVRGEFYCKVVLLNSWRVIPFIDAETVLIEFAKFGVPMVLDSEIAVPMGSDPDSFEHIRERTEWSSEHTASVVQAMLMFRLVALAFGVPFYVRDPVDPSGERVPAGEFMATGERAMTNQEIRNSGLQ